ncbi:MAG: hypothetical protein ACI9XJ_000497 [Marivirga sp.]|jgi:hypothetical protein
MPINIKALCIVAYMSVAMISLCNGQKIKSRSDSVIINVGYVLILKDTFYIPENDTVYFIEEGKQYSIRKSPYFKSEMFYDSLKSKASKNKLTKRLYSLLFLSSAASLSENKLIVNSEDPFEPFLGKKYGAIIIKRVPILEGSVRDTSKMVTSWHARTVNKFHVSTRKSIIRENLFIKTGQYVDPYQLADNERILRQFRTIRDAKIYLSPSSDDPEVVDVIVVTQDVVSVGAAVSASAANNFSIDLYDRNILGFARDLQVTYDFDESSDPAKKHGYGIRYRIPNVYGTFMRADFLYENYFYRQQQGLFLSRDFFIPEIKYGGGVTVTKVKSNFVPIINPALTVPYTQDLVEIWLGRSYQFKRRSNFIVQLLWQRTFYPDRPITSEIVNRNFTNSNLFLINATILNRTYSKSSLIRGFGRTEDITKGFVLSVTYGIENNEFYSRNYMELELDLAEYLENVGFFYLSNALGVFSKTGNSSFEDGAFKSQLQYFSPLLKHNKSAYRQFIDFGFSKGINPQYERFFLIDNSFSNANFYRPIGNRKIHIATETVFFAPWYFYGCKFSLYNRNEINWLGNAALVSKNNFYSSFSIGMRVLNESLVFPTLELKFTYFNNPNGINDLNQVRLFNNYSTSFQKLYKGKPSVIEY